MDRSAATLRRMTFSQGEIVPAAAPGSDPGPHAAPSAWQARALDRSLAPTRARSVERLSQFVGAARSLAEETGSSGFTVQQVVSRSGQSLKSFYRYFEGKDDLLLALLEEDISVGALFLRELIDAHDEPIDRVRGWLVGLFELASAGEQAYVLLLVREHQRLSEERPDQMRVAVAPFVDLLTAELQAAVAGGSLRRSHPRRDAQLIFHLALAGIRELVTGHDDRPPDDVAADLWDFCSRGLQA